jgi:hypothetical protein
MWRAILAASVVLVAAGCGGVSPPASTDRLPPGVTEAGVEDPETLLDAHTERLRPVPYTVHERFEREAAGQRPGISMVREVRFGADAATYWASSRWVVEAAARPGPATRTVEQWSNGTAVALKTTAGNRTTYDGTRDAIGLFYPEPSQVEYRDALFVLLTTGEYSVPAATGPNQILLRGTIPDPPERAESVVRTVDLGAPDSEASVGNVTVELVVTSDGRIVWWQVSWTVRAADGDRYAAARTVRIEDAGSTQIQRPAWVDRALANETPPTEVPGPIGAGGS